MAGILVSATVTRRRRILRRTIPLVLLVVGLLAVSTTLLIRAQSAPPSQNAAPGVAADGVTTLANGWRLAPVGKLLPVGTLPLNVIQSPDSRYLIVTNNGLGKPSFSVIDVASWTVKTTVPIDHAWLGLVWHPDGTKLYSSGAALNTVQEFSYADGLPTRGRTFTLPAAAGGDSFVGGLVVSPDGRTLFATRVFAQTVSAIDLASGQVTRTVTLPAEPYTAVVSPDGRTLFVSLWGGARVEVFDTGSMRLITEWLSGDHPNAMVLSKDGRRLFVACGGSASVWVYDTLSGEPIEQVSMSLYPEAPPTATPNSLALSPDGQKLLVATADNNAVAMVDVSNSARSFVDGFIPSGWYPTNAIFSRDGKQVFILSGKGTTPGANVLTGGMDRRLLGAVSALATPDRTTLAEYNRKVLTLTPYSDATRLNPVGVPIGSPIPRSVGSASPIKHVFYIIRENRTYDQVLGDIPQGNGDPKLTIFGKDITPNAHALAQNFVLFDNFYVDADVSYNGHAFSTAAYATDFVEKMWQASTAGRGVPYLGEGNGFMRTPFGNIASPANGYLWDYANRAGVSVRSYGEFVNHASRAANGDVVAVAAVPGLAGSVAPAFAGWDLDITDNKRVDTWLQEFAGYVADRNLPQLSIIRLANDHTNGTKPGAPTPRAMVADNDLALGRIVEAVSNSVYWKDSAIIALEDDAQSGPDHVDSHRSVLLVASPFAKRAFVDHSFYTTSGVLRTIELLLGLPPMSQYDAAATPMYAAFEGVPNMSTYRRSDARVSLDEKNLSTAAGSDLSLLMNFSEADRAPELLLNEILWRAMKGAHSRMPPPRRSLFMRGSAIGDGDDDEL
jgi:YVTN family beta-propeller protein